MEPKVRMAHTDERLGRITAATLLVGALRDRPALSIDGAVRLAWELLRNPGSTLEEADIARRTLSHGYEVTRTSEYVTNGWIFNTQSGFFLKRKIEKLPENPIIVGVMRKGFHLGVAVDEAAKRLGRRSDLVLISGDGSTPPGERVFLEQNARRHALIIDDVYERGDTRARVERALGRLGFKSMDFWAELTLNGVNGNPIT